MSPINEFSHYSKPNEFLIYVNYNSGERYVHCDIYDDIRNILNTIKNKILMKMNEFDMESSLFAKLDAMCDIIDIDIRTYSQTGVCDEYLVIDQNLKIINVIEEHYVNIEELQKYNINFITTYDYTNATEAFLKDSLY